MAGRVSSLSPLPKAPAPSLIAPFGQDLPAEEASELTNSELDPWVSTLGRDAPAAKSCRSRAAHTELEKL